MFLPWILLGFFGQSAGLCEQDHFTDLGHVMSLVHVIIPDMEARNFKRGPISTRSIQIYSQLSGGLEHFLFSIYWE